MLGAIFDIVVIREIGHQLSDGERLAIEQRLDLILGRIANQEDLTSASVGLDELGKLQDDLARACFKWKILLSNRLRNLVREYDRHDSAVLREYFFEKIKRGEFLVREK